jgi:hypothetical protein
MEPPLIRHIRYADFVSLVSRGAGDLDGLRSAVDTLLSQIGDPSAHNVLIDLRRGTLPPLPEFVLAEALTYLKRQGLGVATKVAIVTDPADRVRSDRADAAEAIAAHMLMQVRSFRDYGHALDWLSEEDRGQPGEPAE